MVAQLIHGGSGDEGQLKLYDSNTETVRISGENNIASFINSGNVGIGVTSPSEILQINKNSAGNVVGGYFTNSQANTGAEQVSLAFGLNRSGGDFVRQIKAITFGAEQQWTGTPSTVDGFLSFSTVADETVAERMRINSSGDILINTHGKFLQGRRSTGSVIIDMIGFGAGTDNLQIKGGTSGGANAISFYDTGGFLATFYNSNFGIGIGTPSRKLYVSGAALIDGIGNTTKGTLMLGPQTGGASKWSVLTGAHYNATSGSGNGSGSAGIMLIGSHAKNGENDVVIGGSIYEANAATSIQFWTHTTDTSTAGGTERMRITSGGRVGISTTSPQTTLDLGSASGDRMYIYQNGYVRSGFGVDRSGSSRELSIFHTTSNNIDGDISFGCRIENSNGTYTERMRLTGNGRLIIGGTAIQTARTFSVTTNTHSLTVDNCTTSSAGNGSEYQTFRRHNGTNAVQIGSIVMNGTSGVTYGTSSDYRLKENVVELTNALDRVDQLKPSRFNFISDEGRTIDGFLAHEVSDIVPEAIVGTKDEVDEDGNPKYQSIDQSKLVPLLVGAIKELKAEIEQLKTQINGTN
tara:strand:- start:518 stop:2251 length:1734 start_codon:yes stop_codon:yes gene_type:complete